MSRHSALDIWHLVTVLKSMPLGKYSRIRPLIFSTAPRCHGLCWITKVNGDFGGNGEGGMMGYFTTVVVGEGLAQVRRQAPYRQLVNARLAGLTDELQRIPQATNPTVAKLLPWN
ncbi:MAG: hypothetical protein EXS25_02765 [Pedosphaera sp.]|nr:hypothetical protein [Pedosphaera sp.]